MGAEEAARILIKLLKEYASHFSKDEIKNITETVELYLLLALKSNRTIEDEDAYKVIKNALWQVGNKLAIAANNEIKDYESVTKVVDLLAG